MTTYRPVIDTTRAREGMAAVRVRPESLSALNRAYLGRHHKGETPDLPDLPLSVRKNSDQEEIIKEILIALKNHPKPRGNETEDATRVLFPSLPSPAQLHCVLYAGEHRRGWSLFIRRVHHSYEIELR